MPGAADSGTLIPFTLQMALVIITGHVLASSPPMGRLIRAIAGWPRTPRGAVALVAVLRARQHWFNWGFSLVFSAVLAIEIARRVEGVDYRALAAASMLGLGSIWAQGLSGSAALQMATSGALPAGHPRHRVARRHGSRRHDSVPPHDLSLAKLRGCRCRDGGRRRRDVAGDSPGGPRQDRGPPRNRPVAHRTSNGECRTSNVTSRSLAGALPGPLVVRRRVGRRLSRAVLLAGRRAAERAQPEHSQSGVPAPGISAAWNSRAPHARGAGRHAGRVGCHPAVPVLCRDRRHHHRDAFERAGREPVRPRLDARHVSRRSSRCIPRCSACSCRRADRNGSSRRRT